MFGSQTYREGGYSPQRGNGVAWHVWCMTGALAVLRQLEYKAYLATHPGKPYIINFANGSAARIASTHPLWVALTEIAQDYGVDVFPLRMDARYVPWNGEPSSLSSFDAIRISNKPS